MTGQEIIRTAEEVARLYPRAFSHCHDESKEENDFIILVGQACNRIDRTIGCNWSRGVKDDLARDGLTIHDIPSGKYVFADIVAGAGASGQHIVFNVTGEAPAAGWVDPFMLKTHFDYSGVKPIEPIKPVIPHLDREEFFDEMLELDRFYTNKAEGLGRPNGLSKEGKPDFEGLAAWIFDIYLNARLAGKSKTEARTLYMAEIRKSAEWRDRHGNS